MARKPLVEVATQDEFGHVDPADIQFHETPDVTYVPGFSDMRRQRDMQVAEVVHGDLNPKEVLKLPVNLRWVRCATVDKQEPDNRKVVQHERQGYQLVTEKDVGAPWLTSLPPGCKIRADGSIGNADTVLMVATAEVAARNRAAKLRMTEQAIEASEHAMESLTERFGSKPISEKSVGRPTKAKGT